MAYPYYPYYQQQSGGLVWVQGEAGAKSHPVSAGQTVLLMDSEANRFYIKSADISGMPLPLRVFDYSERTVKAAESVPVVGLDASEYVTRAEFEKRLAALSGENRAIEEKEEHHNAE